MKILIVYFSFSENNKLLATYLTQRLQCDTCSVVEKNKRTIFTIFLDMIFKRETKIESIDFSFLEYDHIIFISPIWDSKVSNPMISLIKQKKDEIKEYSFISLCGYNRDNQKVQIQNQLTSIINIKPFIVSELTISKLLPIKERNFITKISSYKIKKKQLSQFNKEIDKFIETIKKIK